jgi:hypothetical protein
MTRTSSDKLSIGEIEFLEKMQLSGDAKLTSEAIVIMLKQLADTMHENERLSKTLEFYAQDVLSKTSVTVCTYEAKNPNEFTKYIEIDDGEKARIALSNKESK